MCCNNCYDNGDESPYRVRDTRSGGLEKDTGKNIPQHRKKQVTAGLLSLVLLLAVFPLYTVAKKVVYPKRYDMEITYWAEEYGLDPYLIFAFIKTESGFDPLVDSYAGARGLMQLTEETFEWIKLKIAPYEEITYEDLYNPNTNIRFGGYFLALSMEKYHGDISTAAAAYHSGWGWVDGLLADGSYSTNSNYLTSFPNDQMGHYVYKINKNYRAYRELYTDSAVYSRTERAEE